MVGEEKESKMNNLNILYISVEKEEEEVKEK